MADVGAVDQGRTAPTPEEIVEIMSDLSFFLEMEEATALPAEEEVTEEVTPAKVDDGKDQVSPRGGN